MKYIKLFERRGNKFRKGTYVKIIDGDEQLYKIYSVSQLGKERYLIRDMNDKFQGYFTGVPSQTEWTMWYEPSQIRRATDFEISAQKYNL
jgi:hypothetical protein